MYVLWILYMLFSGLQVKRVTKKTLSSGESSVSCHFDYAGHFLPRRHFLIAGLGGNQKLYYMTTIKWRFGVLACGQKILDPGNQEKKWKRKAMRTIEYISPWKFWDFVFLTLPCFLNTFLGRGSVSWRNNKLIFFQSRFLN